MGKPDRASQPLGSGRRDARQHRAAARSPRRHGLSRSFFHLPAFEALSPVTHHHDRRSTRMSMYGANPEQLTNLGNSLRRQIDSINSVVSTVSGALSGTMWEGPARVQFENDWNTTFRTALDRLNSAFDAAGQDCIRRSQDLQMVMGSR